MLRFVQAKDPTVASSRLDDPTVVDPLVDKDDARDASNVHDQPSQTRVKVYLRPIYVFVT